jgi:hypothetical protein
MAPQVAVGDDANQLPVRFDNADAASEAFC